MSTETRITQAVIAAGGKGERLRPLTNDRPKPMVYVNGHPFLEYLISLLKKNGIAEVVLLLGYLPEKVIEYFGDGSKFGINIRYSATDVNNLIGTRLREALPLLQEKFIWLYGDIYWPLDLPKMIAAYDNLKTPAMLTVYDNKNGDGEYGTESTIAISNEVFITDYLPLSNNPKTKWLDIGFCIIDKSLAYYMPQTNFGFQEEFLAELIKRRLLGAFKTEEKYDTITSPELLKITEENFKKRGVKI